MKNVRIVQKGNVKEGSFDIRITESDGKFYCYHFLQLEDGDSVMYSPKPFNIKGEIEILWDELPFKVKEAHYKSIYPNDDLDDYNKKCLLYGKQKVDEQIAIERKKEWDKREFLHRETNLSDLTYYMAEIIYDNMGRWDSIQIIYEKGSSGKYAVDEKIVTIQHCAIISVEEKADYDKDRKNWGKRVSEIAKAAGTNFDMATVVANIPEKDQAVTILKKVKEILNNGEIDLYVNSHRFWDDFDTRSFRREVRNFLCMYLPKEYHIKLNLSQKFLGEVEKILSNNK